jgi:hypothetical protein
MFTLLCQSLPYFRFLTAVPPASLNPLSLEEVVENGFWEGLLVVEE